MQNGKCLFVEIKNLADEGSIAAQFGYGTSNIGRGTSRGFDEGTRLSQGDTRCVRNKVDEHLTE